MFGVLLIHDMFGLLLIHHMFGVLLSHHMFGVLLLHHMFGVLLLEDASSSREPSCHVPASLKHSWYHMQYSVWVQPGWIGVILTQLCPDISTRSLLYRAFRRGKICPK